MIGFVGLLVIGNGFPLAASRNAWSGLVPRNPAYTSTAPRTDTPTAVPLMPLLVFAIRDQPPIRFITLGSTKYPSAMPTIRVVVGLKYRVMMCPPGWGLWWSSGERGNAGPMLWEVSVR